MRICDWSSDVCSSDLAFEPRGVGARAEDGDVDLAQSIGEPRDERGFGADADEIDRVRLYEGEQAIEIVGGDRDAFGEVGRASCGARVWLHALSSVAGGTLKKKNNKTNKVKLHT